MLRTAKGQWENPYEFRREWRRFEVSANSEWLTVRDDLSGIAYRVRTEDARNVPEEAKRRHERAKRKGLDI